MVVIIVPLLPSLTTTTKIMKASGFSKFRCTFNNGFNMMLASSG
jgi:hypothetical protein